MKRKVFEYNLEEHYDMGMPYYIIEIYVDKHYIIRKEITKKMYDKLKNEY